MRSTKAILRLCAYEFRVQLASARVWLGYLIGIVLVLRQTAEYLAYAAHFGEPVNVLEGFLIAGNSANTVMFLVLGWLLVISAAPFVDSSTGYLIYRTRKSLWSRAVALYLAVQAFIYYGLLALASILFSAGNGFLANVWSRPLIRLAGGGSLSLYDVYFPFEEFIHEFSIVSGFFQTWLLLFGYALLLGLFLYVFSLLSGQLAGVTAAFLFHFLGYETMQEGLGFITRYSLMARSVLVLQVGSGADARLFDTYVLYAALIFLLIFLSGILIKHVDFREAAKGEGE